MKLRSTMFPVGHSYVGSFVLNGPSEIGSPSYTVTLDPPIDFSDETNKFVAGLYELIEDIEMETHGVYSVMDYGGGWPDGDRTMPEISGWDAGEATEESWPVIRGLFVEYFRRYRYSGVDGTWTLDD